MSNAIGPTLANTGDRQFWREVQVSGSVALRDALQSVGLPYTPQMVAAVRASNPNIDFANGVVPDDVTLVLPEPSSFFTEPRAWRTAFETDLRDTDINAARALIAAPSDGDQATALTRPVVPTNMTLGGVRTGPQPGGSQDPDPVGAEPTLPELQTNRTAAVLALRLEESDRRAFEEAAVELGGLLSGSNLAVSGREEIKEIKIAGRMVPVMNSAYLERVLVLTQRLMQMPGTASANDDALVAFREATVSDENPTGLDLIELLEKRYDGAELALAMAYIHNPSGNLETHDLLFFLHNGFEDRLLGGWGAGDTTARGIIERIHPDASDPNYDLATVEREMWRRYPTDRDAGWTHTGRVREGTTTTIRANIKGQDVPVRVSALPPRDVSDSDRAQPTSPLPAAARQDHPLPRDRDRSPLADYINAEYGGGDRAWLLLAPFAQRTRDGGLTPEYRSLRSIITAGSDEEILAELAGLNSGQIEAVSEKFLELQEAARAEGIRPVDADGNEMRSKTRLNAFLESTLSRSNFERYRDHLAQGLRSGTPQQVADYATTLIDDERGTFGDNEQAILDRMMSFLGEGPGRTSFDELVRSWSRRQGFDADAREHEVEAARVGRGKFYAELADGMTDAERVLFDLLAAGVAPGAAILDVERLIDPDTTDEVARQLLTTRYDASVDGNRPVDFEWLNALLQAAVDSDTVGERGRGDVDGSLAALRTALKARNGGSATLGESSVPTLEIATLAMADEVSFDALGEELQESLYTITPEDSVTLSSAARLFYAVQREAREDEVMAIARSILPGERAELRDHFSVLSAAVGDNRPMLEQLDELVSGSEWTELQTRLALPPTVDGDVLEAQERVDAAVAMMRAELGSTFSWYFSQFDFENGALAAELRTLENTAERIVRRAAQRESVVPDSAGLNREEQVELQAAVVAAVERMRPFMDERANIAATTAEVGMWVGAIAGAAVGGALAGALIRGAGATARLGRLSTQVVAAQAGSQGAGIGLLSIDGQGGIYDTEEYSSDTAYRASLIGLSGPAIMAAANLRWLYTGSGRLTTAVRVGLMEAGIGGLSAFIVEGGDYFVTEADWTEMTVFEALGNAGDRGLRAGAYGVGFGALFGAGFGAIFARAARAQAEAANPNATTRAATEAGATLDDTGRVTPGAVEDVAPEFTSAAQRHGNITDAIFDSIDGTIDDAAFRRRLAELTADSGTTSLDDAARDAAALRDIFTPLRLGFDANQPIANLGDLMTSLSAARALGLTTVRTQTRRQLRAAIDQRFRGTPLERTPGQSLENWARAHGAPEGQGLLASVQYVTAQQLQRELAKRMGVVEANWWHALRDAYGENGPVRNVDLPAGQQRGTLDRWLSDNGYPPGTEPNQLYLRVRQALRDRIGEADAAAALRAPDAPAPGATAAREVEGSEAPAVAPAAREVAAEPKARDAAPEAAKPESPAAAQAQGVAEPEAPVAAPTREGAKAEPSAAAPARGAAQTEAPAAQAPGAAKAEPSAAPAEEAANPVATPAATPAARARGRAKAEAPAATQTRGAAQTEAPAAARGAAQTEAPVRPASTGVELPQPKSASATSIRALPEPEQNLLAQARNVARSAPRRLGIARRRLTNSPDSYRIYNDLLGERAQLQGTLDALGDTSPLSTGPARTGSRVTGTTTPRGQLQADLAIIDTALGRVERQLFSRLERATRYIGGRNGAEQTRHAARLAARLAEAQHLVDTHANAFRGLSLSDGAIQTAIANANRALNDSIANVRHHAVSSARAGQYDGAATLKEIERVLEEAKFRATDNSLLSTVRKAAKDADDAFMGRPGATAEAAAVQRSWRNFWDARNRMNLMRGRIEENPQAAMDQMNLALEALGYIQRQPAGMLVRLFFRRHLPASESRTVSMSQFRRNVVRYVNRTGPDGSYVIDTNSFLKFVESLRKLRDPPPDDAVLRHVNRRLANMRRDPTGHGVPEGAILKPVPRSIRGRLSRPLRYTAASTLAAGGLGATAAAGGAVYYLATATLHEMYQDLLGLLSE